VALEIAEPAQDRFAALLHAGPEGIARGYEQPPPMETNLYHLSVEERRERGIVPLPETLGEAIDLTRWEHDRYLRVL
jgi:glutamine synthetase